MKMFKSIGIQELNSGNCTWSEILCKWPSTSIIRLNDLKKNSDTAEILEKWNQYCNPMGYNLV